MLSITGAFERRTWDRRAASSRGGACLDRLVSTARLPPSQQRPDMSKCSHSTSKGAPDTGGHVTTIGRNGKLSAIVLCDEP